MLDITIQKGTQVSIHEQLVTQIAMQIASGLLKPGTRLPSIRALSRKLDIHYNTCLTAYRELQQNGLIHIRHGSGVTVLKPDESQKALTEAVRNIEQVTLDQMARFFVRHALRKGHDLHAMQAAIEAAYRRHVGGTGESLVYVDYHPDILPVFKAELEEYLGRPVETLKLDDLVDRMTARPELAEAMFIVNRYHENSLAELLERYGLDPRERLITVDVGSGRQELEMIRGMPSGGLAAVISRSTIILRQAEAVISAVRGDDLLIRTVLYPQEGEDECRQAMQHARAVFTDVLCQPLLETLAARLGGRAVIPIRVLPDWELRKLAAFRVANP